MRRKAAAYRDWMNSPDYARWKQTADLWTASFFWTNTETGCAAPTSVEYAAALDGNPDPVLASAAADLLADINPLHWPLAFPEAHAAVASIWYLATLHGSNSRAASSPSSNSTSQQSQR